MSATEEKAGKKRKAGGRKKCAKRTRRVLEERRSGRTVEGTKGREEPGRRPAGGRTGMGRWL